MNLYTESNRYHVGLEGFVWFFGVIEGRMDPDKFGRVKVRCFGWHTENKELIPTDFLPWAQIITPPNMPASYTCREGDYVFGFFMDGRSAQHPIVVGVLPGKPESKPDYNLGFSDPNKRYPKRVGESTFSRLATNEQKYPYNWVHETETGHTFELDDNGNGRIKLKHNNGNYVEFDIDGNMITVVNDNSTVSVGANKTITVGGDCVIKVDGDCNFDVKGKFNVDASGGAFIKSGASTHAIEPLKVTTDAVNINQKASMNISAAAGGTFSTDGQNARYGGIIANMPVATIGIAEPPDPIKPDTDGIEIEGGPIEIDVAVIPDEPGLLDGFNNMVDKVAEGINGITDTITGVVDDITEGIAGVVQAVTDPINKIQREIAKELQPITDTIDRIRETKDSLQDSLNRIDRAFVPLERIVGKELFPRTNFVSRALDDFDRFADTVDRMYEPLVKLNLEVVNLNEQISTTILNEAYNLNLKDRFRKRTNRMNREVHALNSYYNLSAKSGKKIPHLGGSIAGAVPNYADYEIETDYETYDSYASYDSEIFKKSRDTYGLAPSYEVGED